MQYGYFDDAAKEYVVTRPDTPASWSNYLGTTEYGAIITNNAGGYSFYKSAAQGRFLRMRFNSVPIDQPGRYLYLRDEESGEYWSASWQPVGKLLTEYRSTCRHGTGYTAIESAYRDIETETTYFVPLGGKFEYWRLRVTNAGKTARRLSCFTYCEFSNNWDTSQDLVNLQYSLFIVRGELVAGRMIGIAINENLPLDPDNFTNNDQSRRCWMTVKGAELAGFDTDREAFLGLYRGYDRPAAVEEGRSRGSLAYGDNACGSLRFALELAPGETKEAIVMLGIGDAATEGLRTADRFGSPEACEAELARLKASWHGKLMAMTVRTPDENFDHMMNVWAPYNCHITFNWSRAASLVYNGERNGLGFRDSVQDVLGIAAAVPEAARERLELRLTGQLSSGGAMPVVKPFDHHPGREQGPGEEHYRSDDCLWFFNAIPAYVAETGDEAFYLKTLPYADNGEATVLGHLRRALEFNLERSGRHGLPCGLEADWNDCLKLGYHGESLFVAFQLYLGLSVYADVSRRFGLPAEAEWAERERETLRGNIMKHTWDGQWFIWAFGEDGTVYGTKEYEEGQVYLNTQVWSVISGAAPREYAERAMDTVAEKLATPYGLMLSYPPFRKTSIDVMRAVLFNAGIKENAGIFNHTQGWGVIAECMLGRGDRAWQYYRAFMPASYNDRAELRQAEPYAQTQTTYATVSHRAGNSRTSWLTGAAAWAYYSAAEYILGIQPEPDGLRIDPCIPSDWEGFTAERIFRGKRVRIEVKNPNRVCKGVVSLTLNGARLDGNLLPAGKLADVNDVTVVLG